MKVILCGRMVTWQQSLCKVTCWTQCEKECFSEQCCRFLWGGHAHIMYSHMRSHEYGNECEQPNGSALNIQPQHVPHVRSLYSHWIYVHIVYADNYQQCTKHIRGLSWIDGDSIQYFMNMYRIQIFALQIEGFWSLLNLSRYQRGGTRSYLSPYIPSQLGTRVTLFVPRILEQ